MLIPSDDGLRSYLTQITGQLAGPSVVCVCPLRGLRARGHAVGIVDWLTHQSMAQLQASQPACPCDNGQGQPRNDRAMAVRASVHNHTERAQIRHHARGRLCRVCATRGRQGERGVRLVDRRIVRHWRRSSRGCCRVRCCSDADNSTRPTATAPSTTPAAKPPPSEQDIRAQIQALFKTICSSTAVLPILSDNCA